MKRSTKAFIVIIVNDPITHWCDYAIQTIRVLSKTNHVFVYCAGNCITWRNIFFSPHLPPFVEHKWNATFFYPFFLIPGQRVSFIKALNYRMNAIVIYLWSLLFVKTKKRIFWFFDPFYILPIFQSFPRFVSVYDCVDYYLEESEQMYRQEKLLLFQATHVFANSRTLARQLSKYRKDITVVPLGFAADFFKRRKKPRRKMHTPTIGFVGGITKRIDFSLLAGVAKRCTDIQFVFYGSFDGSIALQDHAYISQAEEFFSLSNVSWRGFLSKKEIPNCINQFDICCIPYRISDAFNRYCFPMKVMEYFYMGKPVISTPIMELERFKKYVVIGNTPAQWVTNIRRLLSYPWPKTYQKEQKNIAMKNSWEQKLKIMMNHFD